MKRSPRALAALLLAAAAILSGARAADYPTRPIRLVVGYLPGATTDLSARIIAEALTTELGQPVLVENRPGAGSMIAVSYVAKAAPDGYTLLMGNMDGVSIPPAVRTRVPYQVPSDFSYIGRVVQNPLTFTISAKLPVTSLAELVAYAKAHPGEIRYGTSGLGGSGHLAMLRFSQQAGIDTVVVPYQGSSAVLTDLIAGFIDMNITSPGSLSGYLDSDRIRILAITSDTRDPLLPNVPTLAELGYPAATMQVWFGLFGPANLPAPILDRLRNALATVLNDPAVKAKMAKMNYYPVPLIGDAFEEFVVKDLQQWTEVAKEARITIND